MNKRQSGTVRKVYLICGAALVFIIFGSAFLKVKSIPLGEKHAPPAIVNGEPIAYEEFLLKMSEYWAELFQYFVNRYGASSSPDFWTTSHDGEVPVDLLREKALNELVRIKVTQIEAREYGLIDNISYEAFEQALAEENERRQRALANGQPIYGPKQYDAQTYYKYRFSNLETKLKQAVQERQLEPYEPMMERRVKEARIEVNRQVYDRITVD